MALKVLKLSKVHHVAFRNDELLEINEQLIPIENCYQVLECNIIRNRIPFPSNSQLKQVIEGKSVTFNFEIEPK